MFISIIVKNVTREKPGNDWRGGMMQERSLLDTDTANTESLHMCNSSNERLLNYVQYINTMI